jgi:hypothetical protein
MRMNIGPGHWRLLQTLARRLRRSLRRIVPGYRPVNRFQFVTREEFLTLLPALSVGMELGVFKGEFSEQILEVVEPRELHLVDCWWLGYGEYYPDWGEYTAHGSLGTRDAYEQARSVATRFRGSTDVRLHVGNDVDYMRSCPPHHFDWVYLDTSHEYEHSLEELVALDGIVKDDGVIAGDDWVDDPTDPHHGLALAVAEFCGSHGWELWAVDNHRQWLLRRRGRRGRD